MISKKKSGARKMNSLDEDEDVEDDEDFPEDEWGEDQDDEY